MTLRELEISADSLSIEDIAGKKGDTLLASAVGYSKLSAAH
jgi:hypothetical protein